MKFIKILYNILKITQDKKNLLHNYYIIIIYIYNIMKNCNYKLKFDKELGEHKTQFDNFKKIEDEKEKYYKERMQDLSNKYKYDQKQKRLYKCESEKKELQKKIDDISIIK